MYGKHLACHTPHGGNTSLGMGVSPSCAIFELLMLHTPCQSHYCFVGTTLGTMADISNTVIPHIICLVCVCIHSECTL